MERFREGAGRLCLDFVRTLRLRGTPEAVEELPDGAALVTWITQLGPALSTPAQSPDRTRDQTRDQAAPDRASSQVPSRAEVAEAQSLREATHLLLTAARSAGNDSANALAAVPRAARERVNRAAAEDVPRPYLAPDGQLRWTAEAPVTAVLAMVARDALELVASPSIARVRDCANPDCGAIFLDNSRPGTRRWCSMDTCGNLSKKATFRTRQAAN